MAERQQKYIMQTNQSFFKMSQELKRSTFINQINEIELPPALKTRGFTEKNIKNMQLNSYKKDDLDQIPRLVQKSYSQSQIQEIAKNHIENKILYNEQNELKFYQIPLYDKQRAKKRNNTNFRTQHQISDKALIGECKLYKESNLNNFEQTIRNELKKKDKQNILLLGEIYKKLEDQMEGEEIQHQYNQLFIRQEQQNDVKAVEGLENWAKAQKKTLEKNDELEKNRQKQQLNNIRQASRSTFFYQNNDLFKNKEQVKLPNLVQLLKDQTPSSTSVRQSKVQSVYTQLPVSQYQQDKILNDDQEPNNVNDSFFRIFQEQQRHLNEKEKAKHQTNVLSYIIPDEDNRNVLKHIKNYIKKQPADFNEQTSNKFEGDKNSQTEFSNEQMRQQLEDLFKSTEEDSVQSIIDQSRFYERQSGIIEQYLVQKIRESEQFISNKTNAARILRLENHTLQKKIRQLQNLVKQLNDELNDNQKKSAKSVTQKQISNQESGQQSDTGSQISIQKNKSVMKDMGHSVHQNQSRQVLIDNLMTNVQKINDLESEMTKLKKNIQNYTNRINLNDRNIQEMEKEINRKKKEYKNFIKGKKLFLFENLKLGKDCRSEGLTWIIRSLWNSGEKVFDSQLPDFLDQKAKEFLLLRALKQQELQEIVSLLNISLDIYKANMLINSQMSKLEGQALEIIDKNSVFGNTNDNTVGQNQSINNEQLNINLSKINVNQIKYEDSIRKKVEKIDNIEILIKGIEHNQQDIIQRTLNELNTSKLTTNDIIYHETQKNIKLVIRNAKIQSQQQSIYQSEDKGEENDQNSNNESQNINNQNHINNNRISVFQNNNIINKYENREEFVKEYELLSKKIEEKTKVIKGLEDEELTRIIKEYDFKNYKKRKGVPCAIVLCALFGCYKADRELIRNGMSKK